MPAALMTHPTVMIGLSLGNTDGWKPPSTLTKNVSLWVFRLRRACLTDRGWRDKALGDNYVEAHKG